MRVIPALAIFLACAFAADSANAETRALKLYNMHTKERATIVFKRNGRYDRSGLAKVNQFLRDWRRNEPTKMDPHLLDLIWEVYQKTGSDNYIHVVSSYRSPATNSMLRSRSKGVAKNSQHTRGKAMDFFIPGVPLDELRAIGLRAQVGGVGYYPRSGSPFVHMDTGNVRHWPRMSRKQLVKVFPDGKTLHVPSDGKPLPGYARALAAYKMRSARGTTALASYDDGNGRRKATKSVGAPVVASVAVDSSDDIDDDADVEVAQVEPPLPRPSPVPIHPSEALVVVASALPVQPDLRPRPTSLPFGLASMDAGNVAAQRSAPSEFGSSSHWSSPTVPADLARAMAARDVSRPASLPIQPTAVVATVDVSRPLRADAITTAVMQKDRTAIRDVSPVFAYAAPMEVAPARRPAPRKATVTAYGVPIPVANPLHQRQPSVEVASTGSIAPSTLRRRRPAAELTLTALDTLGLRQWIGTESTRQKQYAVLTMPDFTRVPSLLRKPDVTYRASFDRFTYEGLRTDRFSGPLVQAPSVIDLTSRARLASR